MKNVRKKLLRGRFMQILLVALSNHVYKKISIIWFTFLICMVTYNELMIKPTYSPISYLPLKQPQQFKIDPLPLDKRFLDMKGFKFLINPDCRNSSTFVIALVPSAPKHVLNREMIRLTWGRHIKVYFLLGLSDEFRNDIAQEIYFHGDIIQGNFVDSYKNMTYKHIMGLKWAATFCPAVKYVLKADDDVFVNVHSLLQWLIKLSPHGVGDLIACQMETQREVHRYPESKWNVPYEIYPDKYYPEYCRGWAVVYSQDVVITLYLESIRAKFYFWIDDVFVTGLLAQKTRKKITRLYDLAVTDVKTTRRIIQNKYEKNFLFVLTKPNKFSDLFEAVN